MALTKTPICNFGEKAKDFNLKSTENKQISLRDIFLSSVDKRLKSFAFSPKLQTGVLVSTILLSIT